MLKPFFFQDCRGLLLVNGVAVGMQEGNRHRIDSSFDEIACQRLEC